MFYRKQVIQVVIFMKLVRNVWYGTFSICQFTNAAYSYLILSRTTFVVSFHKTPCRLQQQDHWDILTFGELNCFLAELDEWMNTRTQFIRKYEVRLAWLSMNTGCRREISYAMSKGYGLHGSTCSWSAGGSCGWQRKQTKALGELVNSTVFSCWVRNHLWNQVF